MPPTPPPESAVPQAMEALRNEAENVIALAMSDGEHLGRHGASMSQTERSALRERCRQQRTDLICALLAQSEAVSALPGVRDGGLESIGRAVPLCTSQVGWMLTTEEPQVGYKFIALYDDGSGAAMFYRYDGGMISAEGDDTTFSLKDFDRWAYLPQDLDFCCEHYAEDPITLPAPPRADEGRATTEGRRANTKSPIPDRLDREAVARIIDAPAFAPIKWIAGEEELKSQLERRRSAAQAKADAILALISPPQSEEG